ncbi:MAG: hypothetical protein IIB19_03965 [Chloroflexi bacterium]|nr:hypothetical protein [Chloroflexota bacterium]
MEPRIQYAKTSDDVSIALKMLQPDVAALDFETDAFAHKHICAAGELLATRHRLARSWPRAGS